MPWLFPGCGKCINLRCQLLCKFLGQEIQGIHCLDLPRFSWRGEGLGSGYRIDGMLSSIETSTSTSANCPTMAVSSPTTNSCGSASRARTGSAMLAANDPANVTFIFTSTERTGVAGGAPACTIVVPRPSFNYMPGSHDFTAQLCVAARLVAKAAWLLTIAARAGRRLLAAARQLSGAQPHEAEPRYGASHADGPRPAIATGQ